MPTAGEITWDHCGEPGCVGVDLHELFGPEPSGDGAGRCLAHADGELRAIALERLSRGSSLTFARGVAFSPALLTQLVGAAPVAGGRLQLRDADFTSATVPSFAEFHTIDFTGSSSFLRTTFEGRAGFYDCRFLGGALFDNAVFHGEAAFGSVEFKHVAWFMETIFEGDAWFGGLTFPVNTSFRDAVFMKQADFGKADFPADASFSQARFEALTSFRRSRFRPPEPATDYPTSFEGVSFRLGASFHEACFENVASFALSSFSGPATFSHAKFSQAASFLEVRFLDGLQFDNVTCGEGLDLAGTHYAGSPIALSVTARDAVRLAGADFSDRAIIDVAAPSIAMSRSRSKGGLIRAPGAELVLTDADVSQPLVVSGVKLLSIERANVAGMVLSSADLSDCRMAGVHNLDKMRVEAEVMFRAPPGGHGWTRRLVVLDEYQWRAARDRGGPWGQPDDETLSPANIADLYRSLRKGREDGKDSAGAGDFYYGEMEMRRRAANRAERILLWAYWLISGYGMRAWRALAWLVLVLVTASVVVLQAGYTRPAPITAVLRNPSGGVVYQLKTAAPAARLNPPQAVELTLGAALFRDETQNLRPAGRWTLLIVRLLGPVLIGLALLAVRGRLTR
jgi:uncharacterized protein YjbI with pentapeptide repeats